MSASLGGDGVADAERDQVVLDHERIVTDVQHRGGELMGSAEVVGVRPGVQPGLVLGLEGVGHSAEVAVAHRRHPATHRQATVDRMREAEHHTSFQRLAER